MKCHKKCNTVCTVCIVCVVCVVLYELLALLYVLKFSQLSLTFPNFSRLISNCLVLPKIKSTPLERKLIEENMLRHMAAMLHWFMPSRVLRVISGEYRTLESHLRQVRSWRHKEWKVIEWRSCATTQSLHKPSTHTTVLLLADVKPQNCCMDKSDLQKDTR